jgi:AraC family transcriptional regulator, exoenzyme S synthesis regulatory protein ExsA
MVKLYEILKSEQDVSRSLSCRDLLFTQYDCPQPVSKERMFLECNSIVYVISGKRIFHNFPEKWSMSAGVCAFVKKGTHISEKEYGDDWCVMAFFFPDDFLRGILNEHRQNLPLTDLPLPPEQHVIPLRLNEVNRAFFFSMVSYFNQSPPPPESLLELKFRELILSLLNNENKPLLSHMVSLEDAKYPSIENIMLNNFTCNLSMEDYAKLACKSLPTFKREFNRIFNDSPARWITRKRLRMAADLLQNTNISIGDISYECGYENQTHFSRVFKEKMGLSPLQYRKKARVEPDLLHSAALPAL